MVSIGELVCTEAFEIEMATELREKVLAFNVDATGYDDGRALCCFVRDPAAVLIAGLDGYTWGGYAMIEWLWVADALRSAGVGRELVRAAEKEAAARGCRVMRVNTYSFQAPGFYRKLGYKEVGLSADTPNEHTELMLAKAIAPDQAARVRKQELAVGFE